MYVCIYEYMKKNVCVCVCESQRLRANGFGKGMKPYVLLLWLNNRVRWAL